jgi:hypothetical protein
MKKTILVSLAVLIAILFTACPKELTPEQKLAQSKGWELFSATTIPAYTNKDGVKDENLFISYFEDYEIDDILYFYENGSSIIKCGKKDNNGQQAKESSLGNWRLIKDNKVLEFHLPYLEDASNNGNLALLEAKVITLDENTLVLRLPVTFVDEPVAAKSSKNLILNTRGMKGAKGEITFDWTLTYKVAK